MCKKQKKIFNVTITIMTAFGITEILIKVVKIKKLCSQIVIQIKY